MHKTVDSSLSFRCITTSNCYKLEKGSSLAALTVADLLENSTESRVRGQTQLCSSPGNVLIIKRPERKY